MEKFKQAKISIKTLFCYEYFRPKNNLKSFNRKMFKTKKKKRRQLLWIKSNSSGSEYANQR